MGHTLVHQSNTSQCVDDLLQQQMKRGTIILARNVWSTFQISDEELKYFQVAILCCPMDGSDTISVSRCWITVLYQGKEFHNV